MKILMIDDHAMVLAGLKTLVCSVDDNCEVHTAENLSTALQLIGTNDYELIMLDWHLEEVEGPTSMSVLRDAGCRARILVFSGQMDSCIVERAIEEGACGFIPKRYSAEEMLNALGEVLSGKVHVPRSSHRPHTNKESDGDVHTRMDRLTNRQREVYRLLARGLPNKLIARELAISDQTVKSHLAAIYTALGVRNRTEAVYQASRGGIFIG